MLATILCAAPLLAAPAHASRDLPDRIALREVLRHEASAAAAGVVPLPLPNRPPASAASASRELGSIARNGDAERVLVGARSHRGVAGLAGVLRRLGAEPEVFDAIGVVAAVVPSGSALVARLSNDPRVAYIERDRQLRVTVDPFDVVDYETGVKFTWAYDGVRAGEALVAAGGGSARTIAVIDTGLDVTHPEFAGRIARSETEMIARIGLTPSDSAPSRQPIGTARSASVTIAIMIGVIITARITTRIASLRSIGDLSAAIGRCPAWPGLLGRSQNQGADRRKTDRPRPSVTSNAYVARLR